MHLSSSIIDPLDKHFVHIEEKPQSPRPRPVIMFAGEATSVYHPSTIHGAYLSGIREAHRLDFAVSPIANNFNIFNSDVMYRRTFKLRKQLDPAPSFTMESQRQLLYGTSNNGGDDLDLQGGQHTSNCKENSLPFAKIQQPLNKRRPGLRSSRVFGTGDSHVVSDGGIESIASSPQGRSSRRMIHLKTNCKYESSEKNISDESAIIRHRVCTSRNTVETDRALLRGCDSFGTDLKALNLMRHKMGVVGDPKSLQARYRELAKAGGDLFIPELDEANSSRIILPETVLDCFTASSSMPNSNSTLEKSENLSSGSSNKKRPIINPPKLSKRVKREEKTLPGVSIPVRVTTTRSGRQSISRVASLFDNHCRTKVNRQPKEDFKPQQKVIQTRSGRRSIPTNIKLQD